MLNPKKFAEWLTQQAKDKCGYIMCAVGQNPKTLSEWYFSGQYSGVALTKAYYWREVHRARWLSGQAGDRPDERL